MDGEAPVALVPPFTRETALAKVKAAENAWNTRDPERVALAYTEDSEWRNRTEFFRGRDAIRDFLRRKWQHELDYRLMKELWAFTENRISVRFEYEWHDAAGQWFRTHGNEHWEFDERGLMRRRDMSANDVPIAEHQRRLSGSSGAASSRDAIRKETPMHETGPTRGVHHVGLTVPDLAAARRFFVEDLGYAVRAERPEYPAVFLSDGATLITLWQAADPEHAVPFDRHRNVGLHHVAIAVDGHAALDALHERLVRAGRTTIEFAPEPLSGGPTRHMMLRIPGGIRLELIAPGA